ncbi:cingulin isoform X2 [Coregonus clupeaformis]|uniref:Myosin tail domain-containing protein n=1 Tax=Coregonus suidteri TaxID=861788 RepID=A0AAN8MHB9_9TELE|nr:cingulin isoform X2 [Coregonus clupeaformis]
MAALSTDGKPPLDYGVQIRFIKDLHDTGGGYPEKTRRGSGSKPPSNKYGVAVRVQGISGQPYVVLKDGEKGDSYGVQLKTQQAQSQNPNSSPYNSLPQRKEGGDVQNPYAPTGQTLSSPVSPKSTPEDEGREDFGSPFKRPPGDGQAGSQREGDGGTRSEGPVEKVRVKVKEEPGPTAAESYRVDMKERDWINVEEFNEAGLKPVSPRGARQNGVGLGGLMGRNGLDSSFPEPPPPVSFNEEPVPAIDKTSLAPINKLISKFNIGTPTGQTRGRSGTRLRLKFDERRRSRSLDACEEVRPKVSPPSPTPNTASSLISSTTSSSMSSTPLYSSLGMSPASVAKVTALPGPKPSFIKSPGKLVVKDTPPAIPPKTGMPAPLRGQSVEVISEEEPQTKQAIYTILKEGTSESDVSIKRKGNLVYETTSGAKGPPKPGSHGNLKKELEQRLNENLQLQEQLDRNKTELQLAQEELTQLRMAREWAESRVRQQEDQLAELQEELRGMPEKTPQTDSMSLQTDVMSLQADLAEATMLSQRQEEVLRQRERELTALKGALKEEVGSHDQEMEALREQYSQDMETLRSTMEQVSQSQQQIEEERQRVNDSMLCLEHDLESCRDQGGQWREQLETTTEELHSTKHENGQQSNTPTLMRARLEKEEFEGELKELQDSLMSMKKQMPGFDEADSYAEDLQRCLGDIKQARTELDRQKVELNKKEEELQALRRASQVRESELRSEIDRLKDQSRQEKDELEMALEKAKQSSGGSSPLDQGSLELQEANTRLRERLTRMTRLHSSVPQSSEAEQALEDENRSLRCQLEEARRGASRLGKDRDELGQRLEERDLERDALRRGKSDLEEQKRLLDRALEKISKEMEVMLGDSRQSVQALQSQMDEYRERSRRDLQDAQRQGKDRLAELQRAQANLKTLQEEVSRLKKELLVCGEERDSAQLERDLLSSRLKHLESELDSERSAQTDRNRELRGLEDKVKTMEIELDEEKSSVELLNDRVARSREQIDQLRGDLMKERSTVHDLEMDKSVLERQVKELRSRVADMETQSRPSAGITLLEVKIQELEERLHSEEREKLSIQASQRRVERKLKDIIVTLDQERNQHAEQRDQLSLRVKALKRQLDESEGEVERLEGVRRKSLRDLEEQQELQEALQAKVTALESEKRKVYQTRRPVLGSSNLSSEDEDGFYDNNITSILTEGQLHTTNC